MSALSILYLVLPFPLLFLVHEAEEIMVQHRWLSVHRESLERKLPRLRFLIAYLSRLNTKAFLVAALEEFAVLLMVTCYVLVGGAFAMPIWSALFMAFSIHLLIHAGQAIVVKGYVPGLVTSFLLCPFVAYGLWSIWLAMSVWECIGWGIAGITIMVLNLRFAHWLGMILAGK